jgi:hypothetical protein
MSGESRRGIRRNLFDSRGVRVPEVELRELEHGTRFVSGEREVGPRSYRA